MTGLAFALVVAAYVPLRLVFPSEGVDPAWQLALNEAVARGLSFGDSIVFTYGPASSMITAFYHPATFVRVTIWALALGAACAWSLWLVSGRRSLVFAAIGIVVAGTTQREALILIAPLIGILGFLRLVTEESRRSQLVGVMLLAVTTAVPVVVKGSMIAICLSGIVAGAVAALAIRQRVTAGLAICGAVLVCVGMWLAFGERPSTLPLYLTHSLEFTAGYTEAMQFGQFNGDLAPYLVTGIAGLLIAVLLVRGLSDRPLAARLAVAAVVMVSIFSILKLSFVRADVHVLLAISSLVLMTVIAYPCLPAKGRSSVLLAALVVIGTHIVVYGLVVTGLALPTDQARVAAAVFHQARRAAGQLPSLESQYLADLNRLAAANPLPRVVGPVDAYTWNSGALIASGNEWGPRPVFQGYAAYTLDLARLNSERLAGPDAPDWVVFELGTGTIDGRYPTVDDGSSYPELLERYAPVQRSGEALLLRRRGSAGELPMPSSPAGDVDARLGEQITVPATSHPLFVNVNATPSALGRVALFVYKAAPLEITVTTQAGTERTFRLPSAMAASGFLLSPLIEDAEDLESLLNARPTDPDRVITKVRLHSALPGAWGDEIHLRFSTIPLG